mmetsp:Transcript_68375/g.222385  ORF Transcript_68375/g.222385 Transcript_68375/m.222385 type:complete len:301 (-) Transcript_68375:1214-2116(-)|eukprot:CAMPEP_0203900588 /NCGR_PEP_ID=MMETSP0359-20131031/42851_1 /ASSEMBLY_ACC=CAM_ASM_000338 /TAXON_ID=268821 /ORGANISM="Scrippsiella Hangoei, Strain SHTV-5" /LENGTH=300 /DNA_ID=CAMNT_0050824091 /DNA_START=185 /DNA_END=1087 /DNA_ORIENTATION=+
MARPLCSVLWLHEDTEQSVQTLQSPKMHSSSHFAKQTRCSCKDFPSMLQDAKLGLTPRCRSLFPSPQGAEQGPQSNQAENTVSRVGPQASSSEPLLKPLQCLYEACTYRARLRTPRAQDVLQSPQSDQSDKTSSCEELAGGQMSADVVVTVVIVEVAATGTMFVAVVPDAAAGDITDVPAGGADVVAVIAVVDVEPWASRGVTSVASDVVVANRVTVVVMGKTDEAWNGNVAVAAVVVVNIAGIHAEVVDACGIGEVTMSDVWCTPSFSLASKVAKSLIAMVPVATRWMPPTLLMLEVTV